MLHSKFLGEQQQPSGLYPRLLGADWPLLAEAIRRAHTLRSAAQGRGRFRIERGHSLLAQTFGWLLRLPDASSDAEAEVTVTPEAGGERWVRHFGTRRIVTHQYEAAPQVFAERFGIIEFRFGLEVAHGNLIFHQRGVTLLHLPLPTSLAPRIEATETMCAEGMEVLVRIVLPLGGLLLSYQGIVEYSVEKL